MTTRTPMVELPRDPTRPWAPSPFKRLARTHALSVAGDAMFTTAMAGLIFFSVSDLGQARWRVAMALVFTILPFSVAAPFIGPLIDRAAGGRKWMIVGLSAGRALICGLLVWDRNNAWALYPEFLFALVFAKGYVIAKAALLPTTVGSDAELVQANAKLAAISGIAAVAGGAPSLAVMWIASKAGSDHGPDIALLLASTVYLVAAGQAWMLPSIRVAETPADAAEISELRTAGIRHAAQAIGLTRMLVGFLTFLLAFHFKDLDAVDSTASKIGFVGAVIGGQLGFMVGAAIAPPIRRQLSEEKMLMASLGCITIAGLLTALMGDLAGATLLAFAVGITSNTAKQAFDSIVQRDAPDANRGRAFARFETRFQLLWVIGALVATTVGADFFFLRWDIALDLPIKFGFLAVAVCSGTALGLYYLGLRDAVATSKRRPSPLAGEPVLVEPQPASRSFLRRRPSAGVAGSDDRTLVAPGANSGIGTGIGPGIDSSMVIAPATVAAAPTEALTLGPRVGPDPTVFSPPPAGEIPWGSAPPAPFPPYSTMPLDVSIESVVGDPVGLFGAPDAPIPLVLADSPPAGLFALGDTAAMAPPPDADQDEKPVFYDGAAWISEDDPSFESPVLDVEHAEMPAVTAPDIPADAVPFVNPDGSYPEPLWRDADPRS